MADIKKKNLRDTLQINQQNGISSQISRESEVPSFVPPETNIPKPEQVKKRTSENQLIKTIASKPVIKKPEDFDTILSQINQVSTEMSPDQRRLFDEQKNKIIRAKNAAQQQFQETKDTNKWLQVAETLGHALTQLGAGAYGLKHNVDLSGLKFNKTDWSKNIDLAERELDRKLGILGQEEKAVGREEQDLARKLKENDNFRKRAILQNFMAEQQAYKQQVLQAQRLAEQAKRERLKPSPEDKKKSKQAEKALNDMIKKQEQKVKLLDKAYVEAQLDNVNVDKISRILGGEMTKKFKEDIKTPVTIWGHALWTSTDEEEAPKVIKGYLEQAKAALSELKSTGNLEQEPANAEIKRLTKDGKTAIFDANTKQFLRYEE